VFVMLRFGWTINTMTLGGLAVAVGLVVDDAIIDVENIVRRLRQTASTATPQARSAVILAASLEVRRPVVLATLIVGLVFVPILLLGGLQGRFFAPLAAAFLLATLASLVVALTVTPALCLLLLRPGAIKQTQARWLRRLKLLQDRVLRRLRPHAVSLLIATLLLGAVSVVALTRFGAELLPAFREGHYVLQVSSQSGTSLAQMMRIGETLSAEILAIDGVQSVSQQAGRASNAEDTWPTNQSEFHVELRPGLSAARQGRIEARLHELLQSYPGIQFEVLTFLGDRIGESLGGEAAPLTVNIFGPDLDTLDTLAARAATLLRSLPAAGEVAPDTLVEAPTIQLQLDPRRLAIQGLRPAEVLADVETAGQGTVVGEIYDGTQPIAVRVLLDAAAGRDPETLGALPLHGPAGIVRLQDVASVDVGTSRSSVLHEGGRRRQLINVTPATADIVGFAAAAQRLLAQQLTLPAGYYIEFAGAAAGARSAQRDLLWQSAFAAAGIVALLAFAFPDRRSLLLILANLPFALTGGALAVALSGGLLSIGALIGFVTLFGICARNTIMLLAHYEHLVSAEGARWNRFTALRGARERLAPIVMTAAVTALGLLPLAIGGSEAGREVEAPMALVILGGLVSSTLLNLLVMPVLAARWLRPRGTPDQPIAAS
jgi:Cu/Ag efflux pump CusA